MFKRKGSVSLFLFVFLKKYLLLQPLIGCITLSILPTPAIAQDKGAVTNDTLSIEQNSSYSKHLSGEVFEKGNFDEGYSITFGPSAKILDLDVTRKNDSAVGILSSDFAFTYFINLNTPYRYFGKSNFGYYSMIGYSNFNINKQDIGTIDAVDIGTSANGYFYYVVPTLFYNWGGKSIENAKGSSYKVGIGVGANLSRFKGSVIFYDSVAKEKVFFDTGSPDVELAVSILMEYRTNGWTLRITNGSPTIETEELEFQLHDISFDFGYTLVF